MQYNETRIQSCKNFHTEEKSESDSNMLTMLLTANDKRDSDSMLPAC